MRRFPRKSPSSGCIIPLKAIAWLIITMAIITILSLILIEMRRIINSKNISKDEQTRIFPPNGSSHPKDELTDDSLHSKDELTDDSSNFKDELQMARPALYLVEPPENAYSVESVLEGNPACFEEPFLLILATSSPDNFERRDSIRKTWGRRDTWTLQFPNVSWRLVFLVGRHSTRFVDLLVQRENDISQDILIGPYLDTYRNLTSKVMHGFKWAARSCQPHFVLKTDDDCFVNVPLLVQFLYQLRPAPANIYAGRVKWSAPVVRDRTSQWYVSKSEYPRPRYAPYANGAGYILSSDVLQQLTVVSDKVAAFPNEDAYIGTVLNMAGIKPTYSARFVAQSGPWEVCNYKYLFVVHRIKASLQSEQQKMANEAAEKCLDGYNNDWV